MANCPSFQSERGAGEMCQVGGAVSDPVLKGDAVGPVPCSEDWTRLRCSNCQPN